MAKTARADAEETDALEPRIRARNEDKDPARRRRSLRRQGLPRHPCQGGRAGERPAAPVTVTAFLGSADSERGSRWPCERRLPALLPVGGGARGDRTAGLAFRARGPAARRVLSRRPRLARPRDGLRLCCGGDDGLPADGGASVDRPRHPRRLAARGPRAPVGGGSGADRHRAGGAGHRGGLPVPALRLARGRSPGRQGAQPSEPPGGAGAGAARRGQPAVSPGPCGPDRTGTGERRRAARTGSLRAAGHADGGAGGPGLHPERGAGGTPAAQRRRGGRRLRLARHSPDREPPRPLAAGRAVARRCGGGRCARACGQALALGPGGDARRAPALGAAALLCLAAGGARAAGAVAGGYRRAGGRGVPCARRRRRGRPHARDDDAKRARPYRAGRSRPALRSGRPSVWFTPARLSASSARSPAEPRSLMRWPPRPCSGPAPSPSSSSPTGPSSPARASTSRPPTRLRPTGCDPEPGGGAGVLSGGGGRR